MNRYRLQEAFRPLGPESTKQLANSHVIVVGCGSTGSHVVDTLARMGVGRMTLIDADVVNRENLHRQLFTEDDIDADKAYVLANYVNTVTDDVAALPKIARVTKDNINVLFDNYPVPVSLILDCTDNMETRWLINEYSIKEGIPWIYCGVGHSEGMSMVIIPSKTACLRCTGWAPRNEYDKPSGGIFPPIVAIMANIQATNAIKVLTGNVDGYSLMLHRFNVWTMQHMSFNVQRNEDCPVCGKPNV